MTKTRSDLTTVLHQFSLESERLSPELLKDYCKRYPEFASELRNFAVYWAADDRLPPVEGEVDQEELDFITKAMSQFQNAMHAPQQTAGIGPNTIVKAMRDMETVPKLDITVKTKLARGKIRADTIPQRLVKIISDATKIPFEAIYAYLTSTRAAGAVAFKADTKPTTGQQESFEEAVRAANLTSEEKDALLALTLDS